MKPTIQLARASTPDGAALVLSEHDGQYCIRLNGQQLMHSSMHASELQLGELGVGRLAGGAAARILIGGLGLGYSLRGVLGKVGPKARVFVAELLPEVVAWNREFLQTLNGSLLADSRVAVQVQDVWDALEPADKQAYDAILLDIDNGPAAMTQKLNRRLYSSRGLQRIGAALRPGGRAAFWSARPDFGFQNKLTSNGFKVEAVASRLYAGARQCAGVIYLADKPGAAR